MRELGKAHILNVRCFRWNWTWMNQIKKFRLKRQTLGSENKDWHELICISKVHQSIFENNEKHIYTNFHHRFIMWILIIFISFILCFWSGSSLELSLTSAEMLYRYISDMDSLLHALLLKEESIIKTTIRRRLTSMFVCNISIESTLR